MRFRLFALLVFFCGQFPVSLPADHALLAPENKIVAGQNDAAWTALAAGLRTNGDVVAPFTENRFLPFKKIPVVFTGEMRLSPERGLSLHYTSPEDRLMIVDARGVLLRDDRGRQRELPNDPRARAATTALLHVMSFDLRELAKSFEVYGRRDGESWQLVFEPKPGPLAGVLHRLIVTGRDAQVKKLEMRKNALQGVEILIGDVRTHAAFSPEETKKFFR
jgi:hypothetical protein